MTEDPPAARRSPCPSWIGGGSRADWRFVSALVLVSFIHFVGRITLRRDLCLVHYSVQEAGNQLYRSGLVRSGRVMYRDFACQYGPLPAYAYAAVAAAAGNNPLTSQWFHFAFRLTAALLVYAALRRSSNAAG